MGKSQVFPLLIGLVVFGYEIKSPQLWEKTENFDIPGEMTTEITHDVMYVPLRILSDV